MKAHSDYEEMLRALNGAGAEYIVVGAYAVAYHSEPRYTKDLDIWVRPTRENAARVIQALAEFGAPLRGLTREDLCDPSTIYQIGVDLIQVKVHANRPIDRHDVRTLRKSVEKPARGSRDVAIDTPRAKLSLNWIHEPVMSPAHRGDGISGGETTGP